MIAIRRMKPRSLGYRRTALVVAGRRIGAGLLVTLLVNVLAGCGPDHPDVVADIPPRQEPGAAYEELEWEYQKEPPPETDPCRALATELQERFPVAYQAAHTPRIAFISVAADYPGDASADKRSVETYQIDEATVEAQFADFFRNLSPEVTVIHTDLAAPRSDSNDRADRMDEQLIRVAREQKLCDVVGILDLRVGRNERVEAQATQSNRATASAGPYDAGATAESARTSHSGTSGRITCALSARAVRVDDGAILATSSPIRIELEDDETELSLQLDRLSFCSATELADKLARAFMGDGDNP